MLYPTDFQVHFCKHNFCLFLQNEKWVNIIFCGSRQQATDAQKRTRFEPRMFRCQSAAVNIKTGARTLFIVPPITYYTSDRCYCSILNSTPPSALNFIIPVGFLVFYKMFWFAAERVKEGAWILDQNLFLCPAPELFISFHIFSWLQWVAIGGLLRVCSVLWGDPSPIFSVTGEHSDPPRSQSPPERELLLNAELLGRSQSVSRPPDSSWMELGLWLTPYGMSEELQ